MSGRGSAEDQNGLPDVIRNVQIAIIRVELHRGGPVELRLIARDHAQWGGVAIRIEGINLDRRRIKRAGTLHPEVARMAPCVYKQQPVFLIDSNSVRRIQSGAISTDAPLRLFFTEGFLPVDDDFRRKLDRNVKLALRLIRRDVVNAVGRMQHALRRNIAVGVVREDDHLVARVRFHRIDFRRLRIDIQTVVELELRLISCHDALRLGKLRARRSVVRPIEYAI